jgi:hypothetical protein
VRVADELAGQLGFLGGAELGFVAGSRLDIEGLAVRAGLRDGVLSRPRTQRVPVVPLPAVFRIRG